MIEEFWNIRITKNTTVAELITQLQKIPGEAKLGEYDNLNPYLSRPETEEEIAAERQEKIEFLEISIRRHEEALAMFRKELNEI